MISLDVLAPGPTASDPAAFDLLIRELDELRDEMIRAEDVSQQRLRNVRPEYEASALNLVHYLAMRRRDIRPLQAQLAAVGLSSLGRSESHALHAVEQVLYVLYRLTGRQWDPAPSASTISLEDGRQLLAEHSAALFGRVHAGRSTRIMVTMPSEAADDSDLVRELLASGMDCMRINCAHDDTAAWARMIAHLRSAERELHRSCLVEMDLAGPKLRTGPIEPGPAVVKWRPKRDVFGRVTQPARVWLTSADHVATPPRQVAASLPVLALWLSTLRAGDEIDFTDARDRERRLAVISIHKGGVVAESDRTAYVTPGILLTRKPRPSDPTSSTGVSAPIGDLPFTEQTIPLQTGDKLLLTRELIPGCPAKVSANGHVLKAAHIGCTLPEVFEAARPGESIWIDDGKFGGVIKSVNAHEMLIEISHAPVEGGRLRAEKGINFPDTRLNLQALTGKDREDLAFAIGHADMIALSFVQSASDVDLLYRLLDELSPDDRRPGLILKIETKRAFEQLPQLVLAAMQGKRVGIMIARGDLAVECGFERLAEVQEEILWLAEAAHLPVIWATQVLETVARTGTPTRAEITDAAMGQRAECVMLNKGPFVVQAVRTLDDILRRMTAHQNKKRTLFRRLQSWHLESSGSPGHEPS